MTRMPARDADYLPLAMRLRQHGATRRREDGTGYGSSLQSNYELLSGRTVTSSNVNATDRSISNDIPARIPGSVLYGTAIGTDFQTNSNYLKTVGHDMRI